MQTISLFGYAKTTKALALYLKQNLNDFQIVFYDDKISKPFIDEDGFMLRPPFLFDPSQSSLEIPSPGIPPSHLLIKKAKNLISEYDFFIEKTPFCIWVSGTNGKTTTTQMMQYLLKHKGAVSGGNIGTPLAMLDEKAPIWILETSSFTLHYTNTATPNLYVLLPITPDHISWHENLQNYIDAKLKPINQLQDGDLAIVPDIYKDKIASNAKIIFYKDTTDLAKQLNIDATKIKFKSVFLLDAILALSVSKILFNEIDYDTINSFTLEAHRQEELFDKYGRLWINDTKATNTDACIAALKRYQNNYIHLILGGDDKGIDMKDLFDYLANINVTVYTIGKNASKLKALCDKYNITCQECNYINIATEAIDKELTKSGVALLSPAASSLDQFASYAHRGEEFKKLVSLL